MTASRPTRISVGQITNLLSKTQRDYLVDHVDGHRPVCVAETATRVVLVRLGLIRACDPRLLRPSRTVTTPLGREVLCNILGQIADEHARQQNRMPYSNVVPLMDGRDPAPEREKTQ